MFQTLKLIPPKLWFIDGEVLGVVAFGVIALLWLLLPFFDSDHPSPPKRWITGVAVFALAYMAGMSVYGHFAKYKPFHRSVPGAPWKGTASEARPDRSPRVPEEPPK